MEEELLYDIRALLIAERTKAKRDPSWAKRPEDIETIRGDGVEIQRVKFDAAVELVMEEIEHIRQLTDH